MYGWKLISHRIEIGEKTLISWGCEFLDEDWHSIEYEGKKEKDPGIVIERQVWIGSHAKILKGVHIPKHSVIAAYAVVTKSFSEDHILIGGNPARILKKNVQWH